MSSPAAMPPETVELKLEDNTQNPHRSTDLLDAWRQINGHLTSAVLISKEAVAAKKLQRRFWMEEICANVTEEGKLTYKSVWKRPVPSKKIAAAAKKTVTKKRKKAEPKSKKMTAKKKKTEKKQEQTNEDSKVVAPKKLTLKLKKPPTEAPRQEAAAGEEVEQESQDTSDEENHSESEMVSATKAAYQSDSMHNDREGSHESSSYGRVPSWGSSQHDNYMAPNAYGGNPNTQYSPYHRSMHEHHYNPHYYHSAGGMPPPGIAGGMPPPGMGRQEIGGMPPPGMGRQEIGGMPPPGMGRQEIYPPTYAMPLPGSERGNDESSSEGD